jgi:hypothetical protein
MDHCPKCQNQLDKLHLTEGWLHCYCKQCLFSHYIPIPKDNSTTYIIAFLVCVGISIIFMFFPYALFQNLSGASRLGALAIIVTGFIKYPQSRAIKVLFWITMALIVLAVIIILVALAACAHAFRTCDPSCV